jgi:hypothetical protein
MSRTLIRASGLALVALAAAVPFVGVPAVAVLSVAAPAAAQIAAPPTEPPEPEAGADLVVYLMTMGEGDLVWERFGHNAIWIHDPAAGTDHAYNWGLFDFDQPGFVRRFIQGRMWYWMDAYDAHLTTRAYMQMNRSVWVQELNLTPAQKRDLAEFLAWNRLPENRFYRYDYYHDNCSTRVRDALDRALGGQIRAQTGDLPSGSTFRSHTRRAAAGDVLTYAGLMAGLGQPVDPEITVWAEMFLPLAMREAVRDLTVTDTLGRATPLVVSERTLFIADRPAMPDAPPRVWPGFLLVGLLVAGIVLGTGHFASRSAGARAGLAVLGTVWLLLAGILGLVLAGLWAFTDHAAAYRNENLLQFNPLALGLAVLWPMLVYRAAGVSRADRAEGWADRANWAEGWAVGLAATVAALSSLGLLLKPVPWMFQVNGDLLALALPVHVAVSVVGWLLVRERRATQPVTRTAHHSPLFTHPDILATHADMEERGGPAG